jgi:hypothetical protein
MSALGQLNVRFTPKADIARRDEECPRIGSEVST